MNRKSKVRAVFETSMDTIWNSVSFPYKWKFISSFGVGAVISEQVMDLIECISQLSPQARGYFLVMKLLISLADERAHGDSELMVNFLPKRVGA